LAAGVGITLIEVHTQLVALMLLGTIAPGGGFDAAFSVTIRAVMRRAQAHRRAGLLSTFFIIGYVEFSLPGVLTGFSVPGIGLPLAAKIHCPIAPQ
jgi:hypothetical protein